MALCLILRGAAISLMINIEDEDSGYIKVVLWGLVLLRNGRYRACDCDFNHVRPIVE